MNRAGEQFPRKLWRRGVLASITALCLVFFLTITAFAGSVSISDQAGVLNASQIRSAASSLRYPLNIYTVNNFSGSTSSFDQRAASHVTNGNIVISISTNLQHVTIQYGRNVPLNNATANNAVSAFISSYKSNHDYTSATTSSIYSLESSLGSSGSGGQTSSGGSNIFGISARCLVGLIILGVLLFFVLRRNRNRPQYANQNYGQPYPPNYGPQYPQYPSNYGQGNYPQQNQGVNPLVAGGLGAAAGGLLGYELGKQQGEREARDEGNYGGGDGGNFG